MQVPIDVPSMTDLMLVTRERALQDYLTMGARRSLRRLHRQYSSRPELAKPSFHTLRAWCYRFAWAAEAGRYDQTVRRATTAIRMREDAEAKAKLVSEFQRVAHRSLRAALSALKQESEIATTAQDLAGLVATAIKASEMADRLMTPLQERRVTNTGPVVRR